jgi:hypothetical protein
VLFVVCFSHISCFGFAPRVYKKKRGGLPKLVRAHYAEEDDDETFDTPLMMNGIARITTVATTKNKAVFLSALRSIPPKVPTAPPTAGMILANAKKGNKEIEAKMFFLCEFFCHRPWCKARGTDLMYT